MAYFALRAHGLLSAGGQTGLLATNTLAQGDTREVGRDQLAADGITIRRAVKSKPWPSKSAVLEYRAVWTSRAPLGDGVERRADGLVVPGITPSLDPIARATGSPHRLATNSGVSFQGSKILGLGFTMEPERAAALIAKGSAQRRCVVPVQKEGQHREAARHSRPGWSVSYLSGAMLATTREAAACAPFFRFNVTDMERQVGRRGGYAGRGRPAAQPGKDAGSPRS